jgi:hypothetical protein
VKKIVGVVWGFDPRSDVEPMSVDAAAILVAVARAFHVRFNRVSISGNILCRALDIIHEDPTFVSPDDENFAAKSADDMPIHHQRARSLRSRRLHPEVRF